MRIEPVSGIGAVPLVFPAVPVAKKVRRKTEIKRFSEIRDENLGKLVDLVITGPADKPQILRFDAEGKLKE
jgi:hypothetical protein